MSKKEVLVLTIIVLVIVIPIIINQYFLQRKLSLVNDVKNIVSILEKQELPENTIEVLINDKYILNDKEYLVKGHGVIFLEKDFSVMLSRNGMCAMKLPYEKEVMFQKYVCPEYRLVDGEIKRIDN